MSARRSLSFAVRDQLRDTTANGGLAIPNESCDVCGDGRPHPDAGTVFYAVHQGVRSNKLLTGDESYFTVAVTISHKTQVPFDRIGTAEIDVLDGLDDLAEAVWDCIFDSQWNFGGDPALGVMNRANTHLTAGYQHWTEAIFPAEMTVAEPVREEWFMASMLKPQTKVANNVFAGPDAKMPFCGFKIQIRFQGGLLIRDLKQYGGS